MCHKHSRAGRHRAGVLQFFLLEACWRKNFYSATRVPAICPVFWKHISTQPPDRSATQRVMRKFRVRWNCNQIRYFLFPMQAKNLIRRELPEWRLRIRCVRGFHRFRTGGIRRCAVSTKFSRKKNRSKETKRLSQSRRREDAEFAERFAAQGCAQADSRDFLTACTAGE